MKSNIFVTEIVSSLILIILAVALLNPFSLWMPDMVAKMVLAGLLIIFAIFAGLIWKEKARDEREMLHTMLAGRIAFLVGTAVMVVGIAVQTFNHAVDVWLVGSLVAMVLAKIFGLIYSQTKH